LQRSSGSSGRRRYLQHRKLSHLKMKLQSDRVLVDELRCATGKSPSDPEQVVIS
jgi:hypothetical protein